LPIEGLEPKDLARIGNLVHSAARTTLNTQVRVDEQRLKRKGSEDMLKTILATMEEQRKRLALESLAAEG
jgi:hypothetical protein